MKKYILFTIMVISLFAGCSTLILKPVNFAWPIENVLKSDSNGMVEVQRHSLSFNVSPIFKAEFGDSSFADSKEIRIIRNNEGFYFVAAKGFKHIYMFSSGVSSFILEKNILVKEEGMQNPILNQRNSHIELIDGESIYELTGKGIIKR